MSVFYLFESCLSESCLSESCSIFCLFPNRIERQVDDSFQNAASKSRR